MSDYADKTLHRTVMACIGQREEEQLNDARRRIQVIAEDLGVKSSVLEECDAVDLLVFATDLERTAKKLRSCAETLGRLF